MQIPSVGARNRLLPPFPCRRGGGWGRAISLDGCGCEYWKKGTENTLFWIQSLYLLSYELQTQETRRRFEQNMSVSEANRIGVFIFRVWALAPAAAWLDTVSIIHDLGLRHPRPANWLIKKWNVSNEQTCSPQETCSVLEPRSKLC